MGELILTVEGHLQGGTKSFNGHNGYRAGGRADGEVDERILATVLGRDLIYHQDGEDSDKGTVKEEA